MRKRKTEIYSVYSGRVWIISGNKTYCERYAKNHNRKIGCKRWTVRKLGQITVC